MRSRRSASVKPQRVAGTQRPPERSSRGKSKLGAGTQARGCAVSRDIREIEREIAQAARWAVKWRMLQKEAIQIAGGMGDPEARQQMLFISDCYQRLAERAEERSERLVAFRRHMKKR